MKRRRLLIFILSIFAVFACAFGLTACNNENGGDSNFTKGLLYSEIKQNGEAVSYSVSGIGTATDSDIVIPSSHNGKPVTAIGSAAFLGCGIMVGITIPDSVTEIGAYAFSDCSGLTSITVADGNKVYHSSGNCIIKTASKSLTAGCINSVIPADGSVTNIGEGAFSNCKGLTSIIIPASVTDIGGRAFAGCSSLVNITIPANVTGIGDSAFAGCLSLKGITIPNGVTLIEDSAFAGCNSLTSVTVPDKVTVIGEYAFGYCGSLTGITIPDSVTKIGASAFGGCDRLADITFNGTAAQWNEIEKVSSWNYGTGEYTVHCTDGDVIN